ncbi:MAG: ATP-binding protein [Myxococcaceae bacterium]
MKTPRRLQFRLWMKLALLAAAGVVTMHAVHLSLGNRIASRALGAEQERLGRGIARLLADQAADAVLVNDRVALDAIVSSAATSTGGPVGYCFITRGGEVVASSLGAQTPRSLVEANVGDERAVVVVNDQHRLLDLREPIMGGVAQLRLGLDMGVVAQTRRELAIELGLLAVSLIIAGLLAAFVFGRSLARPIDEILASTSSFDPSSPTWAPIEPSGSDELAVLGDRYNQMLTRLRQAYLEQEAARQKSIDMERMAALGTLVAGVTHEVNNPLAGLKNCLHRLERADLPAEKRREYLELMNEGLSRIEVVVSGLLDFARPHAPSLEPIRTAELARSAMHLVQSQLGRRRVQCVLEGQEHDALVQADRHRVGQALVNLLLNAGAASPEGGVVRLRLFTSTGGAGVSVEDDGPGIPPELRQRVFEPFFTTKPPGEGTGLGLSVTRSIIDAHGGRLEFSFPDTGGTRARVWLTSAA